MSVCLLTLEREPNTEQSMIPPKFNLGTNEFIEVTYCSMDEEVLIGTWMMLQHQKPTPVCITTYEN